MRYEFESKAWVDVIPIQEVKIKHRMRFASLVNLDLPLTAEGETDMAVVRAKPGGAFVFQAEHAERRLALLAALIVTKWSYEVPVPRVDGSELLDIGSVGEAHAELADVLEPYAEKLTREPDPKAVTTSASNGRSKATAASLKA